MSNEPDTIITADDAPVDPKQYIRTYAQDFAAVSGKKLPDISSGQKDKGVPLPPPPPHTVTQPKAPHTLSDEVGGQQDILNETFNPTRETLNLDDFSDTEQASVKTNDDERGKILARLKEKAQKDAVPVQNPIPQPQPLPPPPSIVPPVVAPKPIEPEAPKPTIESTPILTKEPERFHSFSTDFADHIDEQHASTFSVIAAEKDASKTKPVVIEKKKTKKGGVLLRIAAGVLLILLASGGLFAVYRVMTSRNSPVVALAPSLIAADRRMTLPGNEDLIGALASQANTSIPENTITQDSYAATSTQIDLPAPVVLLRNIDPLSTFGVVNTGGETRAFFILHTSDYERTFAAMLQWESTMQSNLADLYPLSSSGAAPEQSFSDEVVANRNTRVLKDPNGTTLLIYGYANEQTLIIARNEASFSLLVSKLTAQS